MGLVWKAKLEWLIIFPPLHKASFTFAHNLSHSWVSEVSQEVLRSARWYLLQLLRCPIWLQGYGCFFSHLSLFLNVYIDIIQMKVQIASHQVMRNILFELREARVEGLGFDLLLKGWIFLWIFLKDGCNEWTIHRFVDMFDVSHPASIFWIRVKMVLSLDKLSHCFHLMSFRSLNSTPHQKKLYQAFHLSGKLR